MAQRREPVEPSAVVASALTAAEVQRLRTLAELFEVDGLNEYTAPYAVVVEVAEVAGGPVEDFTPGLGMGDLTVVARRDPLPTIRQFFTETLATTSPKAAPRWAVVAEHVRPYAELLRQDTIESAERQELIRELRQAVEGPLADAGYTDELLTWSLPDLEDE